MPAIQHYLIIHAAPAKVFEALTTIDGLKSWWTAQTSGRTEIGDKINFDFSDRYHNEMKVSSLDKDRYVEWGCIVGADEWIGTRLSFKLEQQDSDTILRFAHADWGEETDFFASCNYNWGYYLHSLKLLCETGEGTPFRGD